MCFGLEGGGGCGLCSWYVTDKVGRTGYELLEKDVLLSATEME
jgi:hypothetical protein